MTYYLHNNKLFNIDRMPPDEKFHEETCDCDGCGDLLKEWRSFYIYLSTLQPIPHELKGEGIVVEGKDFEWRCEYKPANGDWRTTTDMELFDSLFSSQKRRVAVPIEAKEQAIPVHIVDDMTLDSYYDGFKDGMNQPPAPQEESLLDIAKSMYESAKKLLEKLK